MHLIQIFKFKKIIIKIKNYLIILLDWKDFFTINLIIYKNYNKYKSTIIPNIFNNNSNNFFIPKLNIYTYNNFILIEIKIKSIYIKAIELKKQ